jgi:hypothetical protein
MSFRVFWRKKNKKKLLTKISKIVSSTGMLFLMKTKYIQPFKLFSLHPLLDVILVSQVFQQNHKMIITI